MLVFTKPGALPVQTGTLPDRVAVRTFDFGPLQTSVHSERLSTPKITVILFGLVFESGEAF